MKRSISLLVLLAGCGTAPPAPQPLVVTKLVTVPFVVPAALRDVPADPAVGLWAHDSDFVKYNIALKNVADTCRATHAALVEAASPTVK